MNCPSSKLVTSIGLGLVLLLTGCGAGDSDAGGEHDGNESSGEHGESDNESSGEGSEESGIRYGRADSYDETRAGVRLLLAYAPDRDAFVGTVENTTNEVLNQVRVEVHLSNGVELGPTTPEDLQVGQTADITLPAAAEEFETWSAHPEVGADEHGTEDGEHGGD